MTEAAFIYMHTDSIVNASTKISLNITETSELAVFNGPRSNPDPSGTVTSIILGQRAFSVNGDEINTDLNNVLEQVENIKFTFKINGQDDIIFNEAITDRGYYGPTVANGNPFFYFQLSPFIIKNYQDPPYVTELYQYQPVQISLTPYLLDITFGFSEYNAVIGNATENRKSKIRVESTRVEDSILPTNWEAIISGSASPATIQDSMYEDTGWARARYNGSTITSRGNAGVSPAFTGTPFRGEVFTGDTDNAFICSSYRKEQNITNLLHTSPTLLPTFVSSSLGTELNSAIVDKTTTLFVLTQLPETGSIEVGSILLIANSDPAVGNGYELLLVNKTKAIPPLINVNVQRGYAKTIATGHDISAPVFIVAPFDIFTFERDNRDYIRLISNAKILVQGNNTVVDTDRFGNIISKFECEYQEFIVP